MDENTNIVSWKTKALLAAGQLPPIAFLYHLREQAVEDLGRRFIRIAALGFGRKVCEKVWPELEKQAINATADGYSNRPHGVPAAVQELQQSTCGCASNSLGWRCGRGVPGRINLLADQELQGSKPIWDFLRVGGKSPSPRPCRDRCAVAAKHLDWLVEGSRGFLREHIKTIVGKEPPHLAELVQAHFANAKSYPHLDPPQSWFTSQLRRGRCLVMLDGLDEVARQNQREKVSAWVNEQIRLYPRCPFILTSRPQGYYSAPLDKVHVLSVQPFNYQQVKRFVHAWYLENETLSTGKDDPGVRQQAEQGAHDLLERLRGLPALNDLTVNPLLLTMIAMVHRYRGQLPGRRIELYAEICDVLLGHWRKAKGIQDSLTAAQKRVALQPLAGAMMKRRLRQIGATAAMAVMAELLQSVNVKGEDAASFLPDLQASSGLLQESELGEWRFAHLTFQEYLAAAYFLEHCEELNFSELVDDSWWHETLRLYAAQGNATALVRACLAKDTVSALSLAADCLDEAKQLDNAVRQALEQKLIADLESDDPARRKLAAEVKLHRRLSS